LYEVKRRVADVQQAIISTAPVVVTSCIGAYQLYEDGSCVTFPLVVLDEAAQTTEPALLCALTAARSNQLVLVGDTRQLPPTVTSVALRDTLGVSPMARLEKLGVGQQTLRVQYRMPPSLLKHPSDYFYGGLVACADKVCETAAPSGFPWPNKLPLVFVHVGSNREVSHDFGGKSNPAEARLVTKIVVDLIGSGDVEKQSIAVISPYSKQVQLIRSELSLQRNASSVRVGTVDSFQGQETDVVVFSCTRSNDHCEMGFLRDSRRLCVAITRARRGLIIVGDQKVLRTCRHWSALLDSCTARDCVMDAKDLDFQRDRVGLGVDGSVEKKQIGDSTGEEASFKTLFGDQDGDEELGFILSSTRIVEELDTKSS
jgi:superfamily I DNA and/or RNA helicase